MGHAFRRAQPLATGRSNAAVPVVLVLLLVGVALGPTSLLVPTALGLALLVSGLSLLSSRVNPLSPSFYSPRKASWAAVGVVFLGALALLADAYYLWQAKLGPLLPHP